MKTIAPFGTWKSPITTDLIVADSVGLGSIILDGDDVYWLESRPQEKGRSVIVRKTAQGNNIDLIPLPYNVRNKVHEYGGASYTVNQGTVYFVNYLNQCIYYLTVQEPQKIYQLTKPGNYRYADLQIDQKRQRLIAVREEHLTDYQEPKNDLVSINLNDGDDLVILAFGNDFYASPRISLNGNKLSWLTWNHPTMPWDGTELYIADFNDDGSLNQPHLIVGGKEESIFQPEWGINEQLYLVSDRSSWWNLYQFHQGMIDGLYPMEAEFGLPQWVFGMSTYGVRNNQEIICTYTQNGIWYLASLNITTKVLKKIDLSYTEISGIKVNQNYAYFTAASPTMVNAIVRLNLLDYSIEVIKKSTNLQLDKKYISIPETIAFPTNNNLMAYAFYYPPTNGDYQAPNGEKPPLLVKSHGGPTAMTSSQLNLKVQYWTSRGFAVLDVNYGGSTGYGRKYHQRLDNQWGIIDVDDCTNGALYLANKGLVDINRMAISGGSAGGYTTLCALTFRNVFKAGASYYGIGDLSALIEDTHKFESRYTINLVAPYPEHKEVYQERSPINYTSQLSCPIIFFQGLEDRVVPPNQAEMMVEAMIKKGLPVSYITFADEGHGFRQSANIKKALDSEFYFYSRIFNFIPADDLGTVEIINLS